MSATPWPPMQACHKCGGRGRRNLGRQGWCELHLGGLFATFPPHVWQSTEQRLARQAQVDHDYALQAPVVELLDAYDNWADALDAAVKAGTITRAEADKAWRKAVSNDVAA